TFNPNDPTTGVANLQAGQSYTLTWTVTNGSCSATDEVVISVNADPATVSAGNDQELCNAATTTLTGTTSAGTGVWSISDDAGDIDVAIVANTGAVSGMDAGNCYTFLWTVTDGSCTASDEVEVCVSEQPTAIAGNDQQVCATTTQLAATPATVGIGVWTLTSGAGVTFDSNNPTTGVADLQPGTYEFTWTITNGACSASDIVEIVVNEEPIVSAGNDQQLCDVATTTLTGTTSIGTGTWSISDNAGNGSLAITTGGDVSGMIAGDCYTFLWTATNGACTASDEVEVCTDEQPIAVAGADQSICATTTQLAATPATVGTGVWTLTSGSGLTFNPNDPTTGVANLQAGQ
ncbi:MAG: hypothetical protein ACPGVB_17525, partial [Chitinophagales bacterium]